MFLRQLSEKLHQMIKDGDTGQAVDFIKSHSNAAEICSMTCPRDGSSLHVAARTGNIDVAKVIMENEVKVDLKVTEGYVVAGFTPLHCSVKSGQVNMCEFLIKQGADVNLTDQDGRSPLLMACIYNKPDIVKLVVHNGANVNLKDNQGQTPLLASILRCDFIVTELLVLNGADVNVTDQSGQSALHYAAEWGKVDVVSLLLSRDANVNLQDIEHQTALHLAVDDTIYDLLVEHGADTRIRDIRGQAPRQEKLDLSKQEYQNLNAALSEHVAKMSVRDPTQHIHDKISRVFSPGPPIPEAELKNAKTNMLKELQQKVLCSSSDKDN